MKKFFQSLLATLVAFSSILLMPVPTAMAAADTCTWNGSASNSWSDGANWSGCDNGGVPETGDSLVFQSTTGFQVMNNDLPAGFVATDINITVSGYTFDTGNSVKLSGEMIIAADPTVFNIPVQFINAGGISELIILLASSPTNTIFNAGVDLAITTLGITNGSFFVQSYAPTFNLPVFTGSVTGGFFFYGATVGSTLEQFNSAITPSNVTVGDGIQVSDASFSCRSNSCFGASANEVYLIGDNQIGAYVPDPALLLDAASLTLDNPIWIQLSGGNNQQHAINVVQSATLNGLITAQVYTGIIVASGKTLNINGPVSIFEDFYINGADLSSVVNINSAPVVDNPAISLTVESGKVLINSIAPVFPVWVMSSGKLGGSGGIGTATIAAGGIFGAGESPGCMTLGILTMTGTSVFEEELAGNVACTGYDQTTVTGTATLGGATLTIVPSYTPTIGQVFTILTAGSIVGEFAGLPDNSEVTAGGITFRINYNSIIGGGENVTLTVLGISVVAPNTGLPTTNTLPAILAILAGAAIIGISSVQRLRHRKPNKAKA